MNIFRSLVFVSLILAFISPTNILLCQDTFDWLDFGWILKGFHWMKVCRKVLLM